MLGIGVVRVGDDPGNDVGHAAVQIDAELVDRVPRYCHRVRMHGGVWAGDHINCAGALCSSPCPLASTLPLPLRPIAGASHPAPAVPAVRRRGCDPGRRVSGRRTRSIAPRQGRRAQLLARPAGPLCSLCPCPTPRRGCAAGPLPPSPCRIAAIGTCWGRGIQCALPGTPDRSRPPPPPLSRPRPLPQERRQVPPAAGPITCFPRLSRACAAAAAAAGRCRPSPPPIRLSGCRFCHNCDRFWHGPVAFLARPCRTLARLSPGRGPRSGARPDVGAGEAGAGALWARTYRPQRSIRPACRRSSSALCRACRPRHGRPRRTCPQAGAVGAGPADPRACSRPHAPHSRAGCRQLPCRAAMPPPPPPPPCCIGRNAPADGRTPGPDYECLVVALSARYPSPADGRTPGPDYERAELRLPLAPARIGVFRPLPSHVPDEKRRRAAAPEPSRCAEALP